MATDNYFESFEHDTSIDSLPSILSERPSNAFETLINYNITPKLLQAGDLTYGIEKGIHESREFVRKSANRNFKAPQIDRNSMLSPGRKEFVVEISDQNAFLQPETSNSKKYMNKKNHQGNQVLQNHCKSSCQSARSHKDIFIKTETKNSQ